MPERVLAYLSLGSNLGDRAAHLQAAVRALAETDGVDVIATSPVYRSAAQTRSAGEDHPEFLNAVILIACELLPHSLLRRTQVIEVAEGRPAAEKGTWAPRPLDIDILLFGDRVQAGPELALPHPRLAERRFVLRPLADLAPHTFVPAPFEATVSELLETCPDGTPVHETGIELAKPPDPQASLWPEPEASRGSSQPGLRLPEDLRYIAIDGVIGAGKTTLARLFAERYQGRTVMEEFEENPFLERFYEDRPRWAFQTQLAFLASRFKQQQQLVGRDLFQEVVVSDYTFDKDRVFARLNLSGDELKLYDTMFAIMQTSVPKPDLVVYLQSTTDRLMDQIRARGRAYEANMDREYIAALNESYNGYFFHYDKTPLLIVNAARLDFVRNGADLEAIIGQIARVHYPGITIYNPAE